ncbi:hypothetical protein GCK72_007903 [Caenorhabditis remanei]|uniref:DUF38 domain-containing protein n=1 Tax=Caenorhabditis remanei TaxID=31234 RepID=A0A6A5HNL2_CAERE|nr:hypothetical protein GCK72_007903 [Caenorhabditis remanei]KAF1767943.1 hypothetical protein GCK72_007903 [Caenorhabditis remanei]
MPLPLSYPGLKCVLENLEAVKRVHIIGRSPSLQKIDKLIPYCLENLCVDFHEMTINNLLITCNEDGVKFEMNWKRLSRQKLETQNDKMKKLVNFYICGRSKTRVNKLDWFYSLLPCFLAVDTKFRVNTLYALLCEDFELSRSFIDSRSFPLKTVVTIPEPSNFDSQIVKSAETLILYLLIDRTLTVEDLKKLNNKTVVLEYCSSSIIDMIPLIQYHVETKDDIRTTFVIPSNYEGVINEMLSEFEQAFDEFRCDLDGVNERFIPGLSKFSIPINGDSKIHVYAIENPDEGPNKIIVKPVSGF